MPADRAYRFNRDAFAFEGFDEEVIVLSVVDGIYYAFGGAAAVAWPYLIAQHGEPAIASVVATRYGVDVEMTARDLAEFTQRCVAEKILLAATDSPSDIDGATLDSLADYQGFTFERHADMEDLLTLDPIHDVDPVKGWPNP